jgi:DNA/RNA endonuclease YhcR with UshA esterase domain
MGGVQEVIMTRMLLLLVGVLILAMAGRPVVAHHSETAEYDVTKPVKVKGTISKVEWLNPHVWFYVDVKDDSGKVTTWGFSNAPPGALMRRGITKDALKIGAEVTVEGVRAKDGSNNASGRRVIYADGTNAFTATENAK